MASLLGTLSIISLVACHIRSQPQTYAGFICIPSNHSKQMGIDSMYTAKCWCQNYGSVSITAQAVYHLLSSGYKVSLTHQIWYCWPCRNSGPTYKEARSLPVPISAVASHQTFSGQNKHLSGQSSFARQIYYTWSMGISLSLLKIINIRTIFGPYHKHWYMCVCTNNQWHFAIVKGMHVSSGHVLHCYMHYNVHKYAYMAIIYWGIY